MSATQQTQVRLSAQAQAGSITVGLLAASFLLPTAMLTDGANFLKRDGSVAMTAALNLGGYAPTNGGTPVNANDLVTKAYADAIRNGTRLHFARVLATTNQTLSGLPTIDGVTLTAGDVPLLTGQTTGSQNGPWVVASGAWTRPSDWASGAVLGEGQYFIIDADGTTYKNSKFFVTNTSSITVDTTVPTFQQDQTGTAYTAGAGLTLTGSQFKTANGNGIGLDGSSNITVTPDPSRMLQTVAAGVGIKDGTAAQLLMANSSGNASYQTMSGDATISSSGVVALAAGVVKNGGVVKQEVATGALNGTNTVFTSAQIPKTASNVTVYLNGMAQVTGASNDFVPSGGASSVFTATFNTAPLATDRVTFDYFV